MADLAGVSWSSCGRLAIDFTTISEKLLPADAADAVDTAQGQDVYETVVGHARCEGFTDILNCLREVDYDKLLHAINAVPGVLGYSSIALSTELPSPNHPTSCFLAGKMTTVPFILGIQEDEGAPFAISNSTSPSKAGWHLQETAQHWFSEQLAPAIQTLCCHPGDLTLTLSRRSVLDISHTVHPDVPMWCNFSSYEYGLPILGTIHGGDLIRDPSNETDWSKSPRWSKARKLLSTDATLLVALEDTVISPICSSSRHKHGRKAERKDLERDDQRRTSYSRGALTAENPGFGSPSVSPEPGRKGPPRCDDMKGEVRGDMLPEERCKGVSEPPRNGPHRLHSGLIPPSPNKPWPTSELTPYGDIEVAS
ncbi:lipase [Histoplasma capsulatum H143]|uniref:Lipase n=1 Tax=Ajellomyces capsulatus (strain H143) TaxID=544712 RepID=C6HGF2_AJECH|nr:lipase [Histoplasma capsulatum H143]